VGNFLSAQAAEDEREPDERKVKPS
jgi:hypothetical protein